MPEKFYIGTNLDTHTFRGIQEALEYCHTNRVNLYEEDEDEPNLLYSNDWNAITRRTVWRSLRASYGLSSMMRKALPEELTEGTYGPDFEVD